MATESVTYWACCRATALKSHLARGPRPHKDNLQKTASWCHGKPSPQHLLLQSPGAFPVGEPFSAERVGSTGFWPRSRLCKHPYVAGPHASSPRPLLAPRHPQGRPARPSALANSPLLIISGPLPLWPHPAPRSSFHFPEHTQLNLGLVPNAFPPQGLHRWTCQA